jgi:hypothetical protein
MAQQPGKSVIGYLGPGSAAASAQTPGLDTINYINDGIIREVETPQFGWS